MICTRCKDEINVAYKHGDQTLCAPCLLELSHSDSKPNKCAFCGELIRSLLPLTTQEGRRFCSTDCLAKSMGFIVEKEKPKEIQTDIEENTSDTEKISQ